MAGRDARPATEGTLQVELVLSNAEGGVDRAGDATREADDGGDDGDGGSDSNTHSGSSFSYGLALKRFRLVGCAPGRTRLRNGC